MFHFDEWRRQCALRRTIAFGARPVVTSARAATPDLTPARHGVGRGDHASAEVGFEAVGCAGARHHNTDPRWSGAAHRNVAAGKRATAATFAGRLRRNLFASGRMLSTERPSSQGLFQGELTRV
jgi:hypothetical protein